MTTPSDFYYFLYAFGCKVYYKSGYIVVGSDSQVLVLIGKGDLSKQHRYSDINTFGVNGHCLFLCYEIRAHVRDITLLSLPGRK